MLAKTIILILSKISPSILSHYHSGHNAHSWDMPIGFINNEERNPLNFNQAEWQQAKRIQQDPRTIKEAFQNCGAMEDLQRDLGNNIKSEIHSELLN